MGLLDNNRFLFAGNKQEDVKTLDLNGNDVILNIQPKKGYNCVCIHVKTTNVDGVKIRMKKLGISNYIYAIDDYGNIHSLITSANCRSLYFQDESYSNSYYIESNELDTIQLNNINKIAANLEVVISYLKFMPKNLLSLKPTQILYSERLIFEDKYISTASRNEEFSSISKFFKYLIVQVKYFKSSGAEAQMASTIRLYPFASFFNKVENINNSYLTYNTKEIINDTKQYAVSSGFIENNFIGGFRVEIISDDLEVGDSVIFQILGVR